MGISGNLKTMQLAELLQWLSQGQKTGTLVIDRGDIAKRIFFQDGKIVSTASTDPKEYLGHFLVSYGFLDELTLAKAIEMQASNNMMLGKVLTTISVISEEELSRMLRLKAEETIYEIFAWTEGEFNFLDGEFPDMPMVPIAMDVTGLVLEGMHRLDQWERIREAIPSTLAVPVVVGELRAPADDLRAVRILAAVDDDRTIEEISLQTHTTEFQVCNVLFDQVQEGALKVVRPRVIGSAPAPSDVISDADALITLARKHLDDGDLGASVRHASAARILAPERKEITQAVDAIESETIARLEDGGLHPGAIPKLNRPLEQMSLDLSPEEGFILSRVDGTYDIETLVKISPFPPLEARLVFWKLLEAGHIELKAA